jgi:Ca2+-binding EF-hand superfamily protein
VVLSVGSGIEQSGMPTEWKNHSLEALIVVFRTIDINEDGLIDFYELCSVLDEIGDDTTEQQRRKYFLNIDLDHSEGIDFEEFLNVCFLSCKKCD